MLLKHIPIEQLVRGPFQPRQAFDPEKLAELAESIKTTGGLLQPIVVRPLSDHHYEIVAGERRWRAAQLAGLSDVSCLVRHYTDEEALQAAIIENVSRADLNPIEEAEAYQRLINDFHYHHDEVAASVGKSRTAITNMLRLLKLDPRVKQYLITGKLSEGHGKMLASLPPDQQMQLADRAIQHQWTVRKIELEIKKIQAIATTENHLYTDANVKRLEGALSEHVGNRVAIEYEEQGGGYLRIRFNNIDELEGHFERIGFEKE
jgi:ParB family chromosome partitioning protein